MRAARWSVITLSILVVPLFSACILEPGADYSAADTGTEPAATASADDFADMSPAELQAAIDASTESAVQVAELLKSGVNYQLRLKEFRSHIEAAEAASLALAAHEEVAQADALQADIARLQLLYTGAQTDRATFEERLTRAVADASARDPHGAAAIIGEALVLELTVLSVVGSHDQKMESLKEFAQRHRATAAAPALFVQYGEQLDKEDQVESAMDCYRTAIRLFPTSPQLNQARRRLAAIEAANHKRLAKEAAHQSRVASIKRKLIDRDGYFVIYSHETNKTMYRFEYDVVEGADAAVSHIMRLPEKWDWEVTARFPPTADGYARATQLRNERVKKETVMTVPVFN